MRVILNGAVIPPKVFVGQPTLVKGLSIFGVLSQNSRAFSDDVFLSGGEASAIKYIGRAPNKQKIKI
jgi:hypothetical protein